MAEKGLALYVVGGRFFRLAHRFRLSTDRFNQNGANLVRVHIGGRAAILEIAAPGVHGRNRDAHRGPAVELTVAEFVNGRGLVQSGETLLVMRAVDLDVLVV